jgi:hypothetical protein
MVFEIPKSLFYPTFELHPEKGILPNIYLPNNFRDLVPKFYKEGGKEEIENYTTEITKLSKSLFRLLEEPEIRLNWDDERGLTNISLGTHPGFDLFEKGFPQFQEHNLGMYYSIIAGIIAQKYISELL